MTGADRGGPAWERVKEVLSRAIELEGAARAEWLERACADDPGLRSEIEALLEAHEAEGPLDAFGEELRSIVETDAGFGAGDRIGRFEVVRELGRGGMGRVYLAERVDADFEQRVAIKVVSGGIAVEELGRRLRSERRILASLDHPGIARFLDGDVTDDGRPYLVMEYVEGDPIDRYCDGRRLSIRARLDLFRDVVEAVRAAHERLVVHQDIKPSNVLVRPDGAVKLLDFGIARLLEGDATEAGAVHAHTPGYASPEQRRGEPVGMASDVYALGVLLHVLLVGKRPDAPSMRPSMALAHDAEAAAARSTTPTRLRAAVAGDLDAIVSRATAESPSDRYGSAGHFGDDLAALLDHRPVAARADDGWRYRAGKFARRNALAVGAAAALVIALVGGLAATTVQARRAAHQAETAERERDLANQVSELLIGMFELSDPNVTLGDTITARQILDRAVAEVDRTLADQPGAQARLLFEIARVYHNLGLDRIALDVADRALVTHEGVEAGGEEVTQTLRLLAELRARLGETEVARSLLDRALDAERVRLPTSARRVAELLVDRSEVLRLESRAAEAEADLREARALIEPGSDPGGLEAEIHFGLALARHDQRDFSGAEAEFRSAVELLDVEQVDVRTPAGPVTAISRHRLGQLLMVRGEFEEADRLLEEALAIQNRILDPGHADLAATVRSLAAVRINTLDFQGAIEPLERLLTAQTETLGPEHVERAQTRFLLGSALIPVGRAAEAAEHLRETVSRYEQAYGRHHPLMVNAAFTLSRALEETGDEAGATEAASLAHEASVASFGEDHLFTAQTETQLGRVALDRGDVDVAAQLLTQAAERARRLSGPDNLITLRAETALATLWIEVGRPADAVELLGPVAERAVAVEGEKSPLAAGASFELGRALLETGDTEGAAEALARALAGWEGVLPPAHPRAAAARAALERARAAVGRGAVTPGLSR